MAIFNSCVVSFVHISAGAGEICEKGTSTRLESTLALPGLVHELCRESASGGASSTRFVPASGWMPGRKYPSAAPLHADAAAAQFLDAKPSGGVCRWSHWISVNTPHRGPLVAMLCSRRAAVSLNCAGKSAMTRK